MFYLSTQDTSRAPVSWRELSQRLRSAVLAVDAGDYAQPLKTYLRYHDLKNRIIAMPAMLGGNVNLAGVKWIASFPKNKERRLPRAHSIMVLNDVETGMPNAILNGGRVSAVRTAGVSALMIEEWLRETQVDCVSVAIIGFGVIGQTHLEMITALFPQVSHVLAYDSAGVTGDAVKDGAHPRVIVSDSWRSATSSAEIVITCTVSSERYFDVAAHPSRLYLNVSLRDFDLPFLRGPVCVVVDDWAEVCREDTDIERMARAGLISAKATITLSDVVLRRALRGRSGDAVFFNPMGMAVFDLATAHYFTEIAGQCMIGRRIE